MDRIILHVDMDSFYASIEIRENPSLNGRPVVVGADPDSSRGVVSTCSYEARAYGIHSAMPISRARKLCPDAVFLPVNMPLYKEVSRRIMGILGSCTHTFQQVSVDEAYLDISDRVHNYEEAVALARQIKHRIASREGLTCSIGIAPNRSVAKIASDLDKPDGLTVVEPDDVVEFLAPLEVRKLSGVGRKGEQILHQMGIKTIGELAALDPSRLVEVFGKWGKKLSSLARGEDDSQVAQRSESKFLSKERTFQEDIDDPVILEGNLNMIADKVHQALIGKGYSFRTVSVKVRLEDFTTFTRASTLDHRTQDLLTIKTLSRELAAEFFNGRKIRLLGIRLSNLSQSKMRQTTLDMWA